LPWPEELVDGEWPAPGLRVHGEVRSSVGEQNHRRAPLARSRGRLPIHARPIHRNRDGFHPAVLEEEGRKALHAYATRGPDPNEALGVGLQISARLGCPDAEKSEGQYRRRPSHS
jgi:hypothetical protein